MTNEWSTATLICGREQTLCWMLHCLMRIEAESRNGKVNRFECLKKNNESSVRNTWNRQILLNNFTHDTNPGSVLKRPWSLRKDSSDCSARTQPVRSSVEEEQNVEFCWKPVSRWKVCTILWRLSWMKYLYSEGAFLEVQQDACEKVIRETLGRIKRQQSMESQLCMNEALKQITD